jgi:hypothetical protein
MKREEPVSCCQKTRPSIPTLEESPAMLPDFRKPYRSAHAAGSLPSRRLGIWFALLAFLLGLAIPSQARERTTFVEVSPKTRESSPIQIGQQISFKAKLVTSGRRPAANVRVQIYLDGNTMPAWSGRTRRDGSLEWTTTITETKLLRSIPSQGRTVGWKATSETTTTYMGTSMGPIHGWGFWLMPSSKPPTPQSTPSGLIFEVLKTGTGVRPTASGRVKMHYHCYLPNGTVIDSSVLRGEPFTAYLNQMIAGMSEGLLLMREGSKYRFTVPSDLAYGQNGVPPTIGPNQTLMFDIELLEVIP